MPATPHGNDWSERILRVALLNEVPGRVELPPEPQIPDEKAVTNSGLTEWLIPETPIRNDSVEAGPRAGEFLFSISARA